MYHIRGFCDVHVCGVHIGKNSSVPKNLVFKSYKLCEKSLPDLFGSMPPEELEITSPGRTEGFLPFYTVEVDGLSSDHCKEK